MSKLIFIAGCITGATVTLAALTAAAGALWVWWIWKQEDDE